MNSNFALYFTIAAFVLVEFTFSVIESACFTEESVIKFHENDDKVLKSIKDKCARDNKDNDDEANKICAKNKIIAVDEKCNKDGANLDKADQCFRKELGIPEITYEQYEESVSESVADKSKKQEVKAALQHCKSEKGMKLIMCGVDKLTNGPCPEIADLVSEMMENKE